MKDKRQRLSLSWPYWEGALLPSLLQPLPLCPATVYPQRSFTAAGDFPRSVVTSTRDFPHSVVSTSRDFQHSVVSTTPDFPHPVVSTTLDFAHPVVSTTMNFPQPVVSTTLDFPHPVVSTTRDFPHPVVSTTRDFPHPVVTPSSTAVLPPPPHPALNCRGTMDDVPLRGMSVHASINPSKINVQSFTEDDTKADQSNNSTANKELRKKIVVEQISERHSSITRAPSLDTTTPVNSNNGSNSASTFDNFISVEGKLIPSCNSHSQVCLGSFCMSCLHTNAALQARYPVFLPVPISLGSTSPFRPTYVPTFHSNIDQQYLHHRQIPKHFSDLQAFKVPNLCSNLHITPSNDSFPFKSEEIESSEKYRCFHRPHVKNDLKNITENKIVSELHRVRASTPKTAHHLRTLRYLSTVDAADEQRSPTSGLDCTPPARSQNIILDQEQPGHLSTGGHDSPIEETIKVPVT